MTSVEHLDLAPFPTLRWTGDVWRGFAPRPAVWQRLRVESERHLRGGETSFAVIVTSDSEAPPSEAQCAAYRAFLDGGEALLTRVLEAVLEDYRGLRARWLAKHPQLDLPVAERVEDLTRMTQLCTVYVHEGLHDGHVHLGIALRVQWDQEHGAGVLTLGDRIVQVGSHDDAMFEPVTTRRVAGAKKAKPVVRRAKPGKTGKTAKAAKRAKVAKAPKRAKPTEAAKRSKLAKAATRSKSAKRASKKR